MSSRRLLQLAFGLMLIVLLLTGCGEALAEPTIAPTPVPPTTEPTATPTPTSEPPIATQTPEHPTATPTPTHPPETPTPAFVKPQPGVTLTGEIKVSNTADSATIDLMISEDGTSLTQVDVTIINVSIECSDVFAGVKREGSIKADSQEISFMYSIPITEGIFETTLSYDGKLQGKFTSPTKAFGWINIIESTPSGALCDYGEWYWIAQTE